jgi:uncharacterized repeat protein (TIGR01451 family)/fimbrial isopeptide formation D2 family protein
MGARTRRSLVFVWTALFVLSLALQYVQLAAPAAALAADDPGACGVRPLDVVIVMDRSGSMDRNVTDGKSRLQWAKEASTGLIDSLDAGGGVGPGGIHKVGLTTYNGEADGAQVVRSLGGNATFPNGFPAANLNTAINGLTGSGNTPLRQGMAAARDNMLAHDRTSAGGLEVKQVLILLSDGRPWPDPATPTRRPNATEVANYKAAADLSYSIAIGVPNTGSGSDVLDVPLMQSLANPAGNFFLVQNAANLPNIFNQIFEEIACQPGIAIDKTADPTQVDGSGDVTYTYQVTNPGQVALSDVTVTDDKCGDATYQSGDTNTNDLLDVTETWTFTCVQTISEDTTNTGTAHGWFNGAEVTDTDTADVTVLEPAIDITKVVDDDSVSADIPLNFLITVTNNGPGTARDVVVTDPLPAVPGFRWSIQGGTGAADCAIDAGVLTCDFGDLASGESRTVNIHTKTTGASCGEIVNTAFVETANAGSDEATDSATVRCPDVTVEKSGNGPIDAEANASFTIVVTNLGTGTAHFVTVHDELPSGVDWALDPAVAGCAIVAGVLDCEFAELLPGAENAIEITVTGATDAADCDGLPNLVRVDAGNEPEEDLENNEDRADIDVNCPDVTVEKTGNGSVDAGEEISFVVTIRNDGDGATDSYGAVDTLPTGFEWQLRDNDGGWSIVAGVLRFDGSLPAHSSFSVEVFSPTDGEDCGPVLNVVVVDAPGEEVGDEAEDTVMVLCPDVTVSKDANPDGPVSAGEPIGFDITISNLGDGMAIGAFATDTLPAGIAWTIESQDGGWTLEGGVLAFAGDLAPAGEEGSSSTVRVVGTTDAEDCRLVDNTVVVGSTYEADADTENNTASDSVMVECPDVTVTKSADESPISAGEVAAFTIVVSNLGPGDAHDVTVTDVLPAGIDWTIDPAVPGCDIVAGTLECSFDVLPAPDDDPLTDNHVVAIHVAGETDFEDCGTLHNEVTVGASNEPAETEGPNEAEADMEVDCPQVGVVKTALHADPVSAGNDIGFTVTIANNGEGTAFGISADDLLPAGFDWMIVTNDGGWSLSDEADGVHLRWGPADLAGMSSFTVEISSTTDPEDCGVVFNEATVFQGEGEGRTELDSDDAAEEVLCPDIDIEKRLADGTVAAGSTLSYELDLYVLDGAVAGGTVVDHLPAGQTYVDGSQSVDFVGAAVPVAFEVLDGGSTLKWTFSGPLSGDPFGTISYQVTLDEDTAGLDLTNTAEFCADIGPTEPEGGQEARFGTQQAPSPVDIGESLCDDDDVTVEVPALTIDKSVAGNTGGEADGTPIAVIGDTLTYTLEYSITNPPVHNGVITDVLPAGLAYVDGSATDSAEFTFQSATDNGDGTTTLEWTAATVTANGSVSYDVTVLAETETLPMPLINVATIDSDETPPDDDDQPVDVAEPELSVEVLSPVCDGNVPYLRYDISVVDLPGADSVTITWVNPDGDDIVLADQPLTNLDPGILWPGAVIDDQGNPIDWPGWTLQDDGTWVEGDEFDWVRPSVEVRFEVNPELSLTVDYPPSSPVCVPGPVGLTIEKSNDAPIETIDLGDGTTADLPTAEEGDTITYTLDYFLNGEPVTDGVISDVLPEGLGYVEGSATSSAEFSFVGYDEATRTLTWEAAEVTENGSVSYQATVLVAADELEQPLLNVATIDSGQTEPDSDDSDVFVPAPPEALTPPPTDTLAPSQAPSNPGFSLMLVLLGLAGLVLVVGFVTPVPERVRRRDRDS